MSSVVAMGPWRERQGVYLFAVAMLLGGIALTSVSWAASVEPVGRIIRALGSVEAVAADGTVRQLERQDPVFEGDTLRTGPRGRAQLRFTDRGLLSLRPDTEMSVDDYEYSPAAPASARQELSLTRGGFRAMTGRVADENRSGYRVSTPLAVIGVRGTIWDGYQTPGGALLLGVSQGGIDATTSSGRLARLGIDANYNFAQVNLDGTIDFLIEPPGQLQSSPGLDDGGDDEDGGEEGGEEGGLGGSEDSSVATGSGEAESPAGAVQAGSETAVVNTVNNPENTGEISSAESGTGDLPTTEPIGGAVFTAAEQQAIIDGTDVVIVAGTRVPESTTDGETTQGGIGVGSGIGTVQDGEPLIAGALDVSNFDEAFLVEDRATLFAQATAFLNNDSNGSPSNQFPEGLFAPAGGAAGVLWGGFGQPVRIFTDLQNSSTFIETLGAPDVLFAIGTPTDIAPTTGTTSFGLLEFRASSTGGFVITDVESDATLDFATGALDGILDVVLASEADLETELFSYIVDFDAQVDGGLLLDARIFDAELFDIANQGVLPVEGEITGFISGVEGEYLNLGFAYSTPGRTDLDVLGVALLQQGLLPPTALSPEELVDLSAGFGAAVVSCCFGGPFANRITDPRDSSGLETVISFNGALSTFDPAFNEIPANNTIIRRDDALVQFFSTLDAGGGAELSFYELQGFSETTGDGGGPFGFYEADTGALLFNSNQELLVLAGRIADIADLTGTARFELFGLAQGFFVTQSGVGVSLVDPGLQDAGDISFNVDFATAEITEGFFRLFTDVEQIGAPLTDRDRVIADFQGNVALSNGNPFVDFQVLGGLVFDSDGDNGGFAQINIPDGADTEAPSFLSGFFAGDGSVFNLAFSLTTEESPANRGGFIEPVNFVGNAVLTEADLGLSAAEAAELGAGRVFVAATCCDFDGSTGAGPSTAVSADGSAVFGINLIGPDTDALPSDPGFLGADVEAFVRDNSAALRTVIPDFPVPAEIELTVGAWERPGGSAGFLIDPATGEIIEGISEQLFFHVGFPSTVASLQAEGGLRTFSGASNVGSPIINARTLGGLGDSNIFDLDPSLPQIAGATVSFNVDLATGQVYNGHLFSVVEIDTTGSFPEEFGFEVFFNGQLGYAGGNTFIDANIIDGVFGETVAIDPLESAIELFIAGDGPAAMSSFLAQGAYNLQTVVDNEFGERIVVGGTFSIGSDLLPETRLSLADATEIDEGRIGIVAYSDLDFLGFDFAPDATGAGGFLLGRANAPVSDGGTPGSAGTFLVGANYYHSDNVRDPVTGVPVLDMAGEPVLTPANTARRGFFSQPYNFVVRQGTAPEVLFDADVVPTGGVSETGFEITWGVWDSDGDTIGAVIQDKPDDAVSQVVVDRELFFASVNPTPQSQMPTTGTFSYATADPATFGVDYLATANGTLNALPPGGVPLDYLGVGFDVDFNDGNITNGALFAGYAASSTVDWFATFDGFVNGNVADLQFDFAEVAVDGSPGFLVVDLAKSEIGGVFTGSAGGQLVGGFNLTASDGAPSLPTLESIQGLFILQQGLPAPIPPPPGGPMGPLPPGP